MACPSVRPRIGTKKFHMSRTIASLPGSTIKSWGRSREMKRVGCTNRCVSSVYSGFGLWHQTRRVLGPW